MLIFYFLVRFGPLIRGSFVYFLCTRVAPLCAFLMNFYLSKKKYLNDIRNYKGNLLWSVFG
jgi:hypothetical protein